MQRIKNLTLVLANFLGIGLILSQSYDLVFNPTLFVDEGLYLGASQAILGGDLFLRTYGFDKPFLLPWWPLLGILSFGFTPLGMKFVGLLVYLISFVFFQKTLNRLAQQPWINFLLALILFQLPVFQTNGISALSEPYILFCLTMCLYFWSGEVTLRGSEALPERRTVNWFLAGVFTKYSVLIWAPLFLVSWSDVTKGRYVTALRSALSKTKTLLKRHWIWFAAFLLFSITASAKFASVTWFSFLGTYLVHGPSTGERFLGWCSILNASLGFNALIWVLLGLGLIYERKRIWKNPLLLGIVATTLFNFVVVILSGVSLFDRYLLMVLPGFFLTLSILIFQIRGRIRFFIPSVVVLLSVWLSFAATRPKVNIGGTPELGRLMTIAAQELNHPDVILHTDYVWWIRGFTPLAIRTGCKTDDCVRSYRDPHQEQRYQFALIEDEAKIPVLLRGFDASLKNEKKKQDSYDLEKSTQGLLKSLRMGKWAQVVDAQILPQTEPQNHLRATTLFRPFLAGPLLRVQLDAKGHQIEIEATLTQSDMHEYPHAMNFRRERSVAVIHRFKVDGHDVTDLTMPLFFGGYVQRI